MDRPKNGKTMQERKKELEEYNQARREHALAIQQEVSNDATVKTTTKKQP
jgi:hypothetical protein